jgi:O-acetyl-ADP-ribose deacetylase (regulator of RNase III)
MQIILTAVEDSLADAWRRFCGDLDFVRVYRGSILDIPCDAIVSPANSFGFMDGGIDFVYMRHFGPSIEERVQSMIRERHQGELLVGTADLVDTEDPSFPYLIVAPTMRVPMPLTDSVNPYLAARAIFRLVKHGRFSFAAGQEEPIRDRIRTMALPGLGTGVGQVGPNTCARQVREAINDVILDRFSSPKSWVEANVRHQLLYRDRPAKPQ